MKYCPECGKRLVQRIPYGDRKVRHVCDSCLHIEYDNPRVLVGCVAEWEGRVLMCQTGAQPGATTWTIPLRYLESGESGPDACRRAALEDTGTQIRVDRLLALTDVPEAARVYAVYRGRLARPTFDRSGQNAEIRLMRASEIPWQSISDPVVAHVLRRHIGQASDALAEPLFGGVPKTDSEITPH